MNTFVEVHSVPTTRPSFNMYLHVLVFLSWLLLPQPTLVISTTPNYTANAAAVTNNTFFIARNDSCSLKCGNLTVPYPFGIGVGSGCSISPWFDINCNTSFDPPKAFIRSGNIEVRSISQTQVRIRNSVASACHDNNGSVTKSFWDSFKFGDPGVSPYTFSDVANTFTVVGCDDYALILGTFGRKNLNSGCMSQCKETDVSDETGYCQTDIPKGLTYYNISLRSFNNHTTGQVSSFNPCSYAFLGEKDSFKFNGMSDFEDTNFLNRTEDNVPIVLDYVVDRNKTCDEARSSSTSLCLLHNALCNDSDSGYGGYLCGCKEGYEGNPYLSPGCTDINECEDSNLNDCDKVNGICHNTLGNYFCDCNPHYYGDGKSCTKKASQFSVIQFSLGVVGSFIGVLVLIAFGFWLYRHLKRQKKIRIKQKFFKRNGGLLFQQQISSSEGSVMKTKLFTAKELEKATNKFNQSRVLGKGGVGTVYKGMLQDGSIVAVKKSNITTKNQVGQFINEVSILLHIDHRNVVKLLGCCLETDVPLLVYEYVSNGTLSHHLHDEGCQSMISWENRLRIAKEVAEALAYLHSYASTSIFHRDIKSSNILLDENFRAIVSDFGLSRSVSIEKTHLTTVVGGTFGYLDPEYFRSGQFTDKSDVYAFGVVLAELLTRVKAVSLDVSKLGLVMYFQSSMKQNRLFEILDPLVVEEGVKEDILVVVKLAKRCLKRNAKKRPSMREVATNLDRLTGKQIQPSHELICHDNYLSKSECSYSYATVGDSESLLSEEAQTDIYPMSIIPTSASDIVGQLGNIVFTAA